MKLLPGILALLLSIVAGQARADKLQDSFDTAWESLWYQGGAPVTVVRWQDNLRVRIHGVNHAFHKERILKALETVARIAGREVVDVSDAPDAESRANLEVSIVDNNALQNNHACYVSHEKINRSLIEQALLKMRVGAVYHCVLHEAMHVMGILGHPAGDTVLSYFHQRVDVITDLDRLMLRAWYSPAMRPGMAPFAALRVLTDHIVDADAGATPDAAVRQVRFLDATRTSMEAFVTGTGEVPVVLKRSGTASAEGMRTGRIRMAFFLGLAYLQGNTVAVDPARAAFWFERSARDGLAAGQFAMGYMYKNGEGVQASATDAYMWFGLAAAQDHATAVVEMKRVESTLTAEQLEQAKERLRQFK